ncbi:hypothetical protein [Puniceibacterium sp. IMCC21224]|uniref:hypothetical protein n=1 Tax=Puniceibacterium sp. IMCC21224 TaxID=1618204 RepID=UPI00064DCA77|nr:hypothetical protein [Puniceibacterium sp. IMCC21224]KMK65765.1 hypothetical protein IMCC21224_11600 [Puniceibacterium sp. IMCC21224]
MRCALLFVLLILTACGRPLTPNEVRFLHAMHGPALNPDQVRLVRGHPAAAITTTRPVRPRLTCQERLYPPSKGETVTVAPGATTLFGTVLFRKDLYRDDFVPGFPDRIDVADAMLLAHEMTHVWQWQNRALTGYHPLKAVSEHGASADPYLFDPDSPGRFLDYGYEQQGAVVEEYVCCQLLDPEAPRTERLRAMITEAMPMTRLDAVLGNPAVRLPWRGAARRGICR